MNSPRRASLSGLLAVAAGLGVGELAAGIWRAAASPVVPPGQYVIDRAPRWLKDFAIETFGTADKAVLVVGSLLVLFGLGTLVGHLAATGRLRAALWTQAAVAALGVAAVLRGPDPTFVEFVPPVVASITAGTVLWLLVVRGRAPDLGAEPAAEPVAAMGPDRRTVLMSSVAVASGAAITGGLGRWLARRHEIGSERATIVLPEPVRPAVPLPAGVDLGVPGAEPFLTPVDAFYRIDTALVVPQVRRDDWSLRIHGLVDRELTLTYDELVSRPLLERYVTLSCVSNEIGGDLVGNARWLGVSLADLLAEAGIDAAATQLASRSIDGWTCGTPVSAVTDGRDALLAVAMNGEPLPAEHGYPVRMVIPGLYGYVSATKWVTELELTTWEDFSGYWVPRGWAREAPVKVMSRIDTPRSRVGLVAGPVPVAGLAWAVHRGIGAVEVRVDDGEWQPAELAGVPSDDTWRQWRFDWDGTPGDHTIAVRATTADGEVQSPDPRPVAPDGAEGHHTIRVSVA